MEFAFTSEQQLIADLAGQLFAEQATSERTRAAMAGDGIDPALWSAFSQEAGLAALAIPEVLGGAGLGLIELAIVAEAAGRHLAALPLIPSLGLVAPALVAGGSAEQCDRWLPLLASGEAVGVMGEAGGLRVESGRISGCAPLVAHGAAASLLLLLADGVVWLVERGDGIVVEPQTSMDQTRPLARLRFEDVPAEPLADPVAACAAMRRWGLTTIAADALGGAEACLARTVRYAGERVQFGHPIGTFQAVKHRLADVAVAIEQARSAVYWAAAAAEDSAEAMLAAHAAKAVACETYVAAAAAMIQLHGGIGFTWEHDAHLFFKRATADRSWMGAPDVHLDAVADAMLGEAA
jgi:alkylation response protein AidB-like acyl-CoA dehydrogenase